MPDNEVSFLRFELKAISIDGDTLHFDLMGELHPLRCEDVDLMCDILNQLADQFVPITDGEGRQINPYYGDESLGLDRPGHAFYVETRGADPLRGPQSSDITVEPAALMRQLMGHQRRS